MKQWVRATISLVVICVLSVGLLFGMNAITKARIEEQSQGAANQRLTEVLAASKYEAMDLTGADSSIKEAFKALNADGSLAGYVVEVIGKGFGGDLPVLVGINADGSAFTGLRVGENKETEGIGTKVMEEGFYGLFTDLKAGANGAEVDTIAGATVSSKAVISAANIGWQFVTGKEADGGTSVGESVDPKTAVLPAYKYQPINLADAPAEFRGVTAAYSALNSDGQLIGYVIEAAREGYGGNVPVTVGFSADGTVITGIRVGANSETQGIGSKVMEDSFYSQFVNLLAPASFTVEEAPATEQKAPELADGTYYAEEADFDQYNGYKYFVELTISGGKITAVNWDAKHKDAGQPNKKQASIDGTYDMKNAPGLWWHEQAKIMEDELVKTQNPATIKFGDDGKTDAIAGVTVTVDAFANLAADCLNQAKAPKAALADGTYYAEEADFDQYNGYKYFVELTISGGKITAVNWDAKHKDASQPNKKQASIDGTYDMKNAPGLWWHEQAKIMEDELLKTQNPATIKFGDDGKTDAIAGVTVTVDAFANLAADCLNQAKAPKAALADGTYYAEEADFDQYNGYKYFVELNVSGGKIIGVNWDAKHKDATQPNKKQASIDGTYDMKNAPGLWWHEQAWLMEEELLKTQNPATIKFGDDGKTDAIAGVTVTVDAFANLAADCLNQAKAPKTALKDGVYKAEEAAFNEQNGYKNFVEITVEGGKITVVNWDAQYKDDTRTNKKQASIEGTYNMNNAPGLWWHEQAKLMEDELIKTQNPASVPVADNGKTDAIAGVTVTVQEFTTLASEALAQAKVEETPAPAPAPVGVARPIDAIAGATVSSEAVVDAVNYAWKFVTTVILK